MKKTIITLMALAGVATASELTLTTGIKYDGVLYDGYTDITGGVQSYGYSSPGTYTVAAGDTNISCSFDPWPGEADNINFTVTLKELYGADAISTTDSITLNSFAYRISHSAWSQDDDNGNKIRTITLSVDNAQVATFTLTANDPHVDKTNGIMVISGLNTTLTKDSVLTLSISGEACSLGLASTSTTGATWSGVTPVTTKEVTNGTPLVSLGITTAPIPEPTTATLSLLALTGLAARRRRK